MSDDLATPDTATPGTCSSCGAPVVWQATDKGQRMPLDPTVLYVAQPLTFLLPQGPTISGLTFGGSVVRGAPCQAGDANACAIRISHFATCPNAQQHRKGRRAHA